MSHSNRALIEHLDELLRAIGFRKSGSSWRLVGADNTIVVNLQGSQYSAVHFLNVGVLVRDIEDTAKPSESKCHVRARFDSLVGERAASALRRLLDEPRDVPGGADGDVELAVKEFGVLVPQLSELSGVCKLLANGTLAGAIIDRRVREICCSKFS